MRPLWNKRVTKVCKARRSSCERVWFDVPSIGFLCYWGGKHTHTHSAVTVVQSFLMWRMSHPGFSVVLTWEHVYIGAHCVMQCASQPLCALYACMSLLTQCDIVKTCAWSCTCVCVCVCKVPWVTCFPRHFFYLHFFFLSQKAVWITHNFSFVLVLLSLPLSLSIVCPSMIHPTPI